MKRPNRTVSIFSLSALDLLAMSTGVFVLLLIMLMPYYRKDFDATAEIAGVRAAVSEIQAQVDTTDQSLTLYRGEAEARQAEAARLNATASAIEQTTEERRSRMNATAAAPRNQPTTDPQNLVIDAIDLIFVIDTTASMTKVLRELAISMRSIVAILERLVPSVRIGVVAYKDRDTGLPPITTLPLTSTDRHLPRIMAFVENLGASPVGSQTIEEDVHLGLAAAMAMPLRSGARQTLVVIGDAAAHPPLQSEVLGRTRNFVRQAPKRTVSALFVETDVSRRFGNRDRVFFEQLADAGNGPFNNHAGNVIESVLLSVLVD